MILGYIGGASGLNPSEFSFGVNDFLVLVYADSGSIGGPKELKVLNFQNKYYAINYFFKTLIDLDGLCEAKDLNSKRQEIDASLNRIASTGSDKDIDLYIVNFENSGILINIICGGYWDEVVYEIVGHIKENFIFYDPDFNDDFDEVKISELNLLITSKINLCDELIKCIDIHDKNFIDKFTSLCDFFNEFFND